VDAKNQKRKHPPPSDHAVPYEVTDGLFISGHPDHARDFLSKDVQIVVDLQGDVDTSVMESEEQGNTTLYLYWPVEDGDMPNPDVVRNISRLVAGALASGEKVLVHCRSGHNRSGLVCARTLIEQGRSPEEAIETVRTKRGDGHALGNRNFVEWLEGEKPPRGE
jgi:protein-tyrosine phosphatase